MSEGRVPRPIRAPARPWHRGCDDPGCTNCPRVPIDKDVPEERCLLCHIDKRVTDPDERLGAYLAVSDYSLMSHGIPWHCFVDPCRKHNMLLPRGAGKMLDTFDAVGQAFGVPPVGKVNSVQTKRVLAEIENELHEIHDERDERREAEERGRS